MAFNYAYGGGDAFSSNFTGLTPRDDEDAVKDAEVERTPRQLPNIWPDLRPKPQARLMPDDDEYMKDQADRFNVGDRVIVSTLGALGNRRAVVRYIGKTPIAPGYWIGVEYDEMQGKNDGSVKGERFFQCSADHGGFIRPSFCKIDTRPPPGVIEAIAAAQAAAEAEVNKVLAPPKVAKKRSKRPDRPSAASASAAANVPAAQSDNAPAAAPSAEPAAEGEANASAGGVDSVDGGAAAPADAPASSTPDRRRPRQSKDSDVSAAAAAASSADVDVEVLDDSNNVLLVDSPNAARRDAWLEKLPQTMHKKAIEHLAALHKLTLAEARKKFDATFAARRSWELAPDEATREKNRAAAEASSADGPGLSTSIVRQLGVFTVVVRDEHGNQRQEGGEPLAVAIRGTSNVRARLTDNNDGTYTCKYRAWVSGDYSISIWLHGENIGQSPYAMQVLSTRAFPSKCELRGTGLTNAVSREPASFEVEYVDAFGQVCYAEELDVYLELVYSPRYGSVNKPVEHGYLIREPGALPVVPSGAGLSPEARKREMKRRQSFAINHAEPAVHLQGTDLAISLLPPDRRPAAWKPPEAGVKVTTAEEDLAAMEAARAAAAALAPAPAEKADKKGSPTGAPTGALSRGMPTSKRAEAPSQTSAPAVGAPAKSDDAAASSDQFSRERFLEDSGGEPVPPEGFRAMKRPSILPQQLMDTLMMMQPKVEYCRLDAVERQQHMQLWARRRANEHSKYAGLGGASSVPGDSQRKKRDYEHNLEERHQEQERRRRQRERDLAASEASTVSFQHELKGDRKGYGFAYGGVSPGTLHAKGQLVRVHTVHYSVGLAGKYRLHVGLRQQSVALPGSPFELEVAPGAAYAPSTRLPTEQLPLRGVVGDKWRGMVIFANDKIGNQCIRGGAKVRISVDSDNVAAEHTDNGDGSYGFQWRSERSGTYNVAITIDSAPVVGSPTTLTMLAGGLDVGKCEASGDGLLKAVAGSQAVLRVKIKDKYGNAATPSTKLRFLLSLQPAETNQDAKEKRRKATAQATQSDAELEQGKMEEKIQRQLQQGQSALPKSSKSKQQSKEDDAKVERRKRMQVEIPTIPFEGFWVDGEYEMRYVAQKAGDHLLHVWADPEGAGVRETLPGSPFEVSVVEAHPAAASSTIGYSQEEKKAILSGEKLMLKPQLRDQFGNPSAAPADALKALLEAPDGTYEIEVRQSNRGLGAYEVAHETVLKGEYVVHVELNGMPVGGSPALFFVEPSVATANKSILQPPKTEPLTHQLTELELIAVDKLGNTLEKGGARLDARVLGPNAGPCTCTDRKDGTYTIQFTAGAIGEYRVIARLDNVELAALALIFGEGREHRTSSSSASASLRDDDGGARRAKGSSKSRRGSVAIKAGDSGASFDLSSDAGSRDTTPAASRTDGGMSAQGSFMSAQGSLRSAQGSMRSAQGSLRSNTPVSAQASMTSAQGSVTSDKPSLDSDTAKNAGPASPTKKIPAAKPLAVGKAIGTASKGPDSHRGGAGTNRGSGATTNRRSSKVKFDNSQSSARSPTKDSKA